MKKKNKKQIIIGTVVSLVLISVALFFLYHNSFNQNKTQTGKVVATVNGEEINSNEIDLVEEYFLQQGQKISREDILQELIIQELFLQKANEEGFEISTEELEFIIKSQLKQQNLTLEDYKKQLEMQGILYENEIENYKEQIAIQKYLSNEISEEKLEVTDNEAYMIYEMYNEQSPEELPPFEEIKSEIILSLEQQKQQEAMNQLAQKLLSDADIEYL